MDFQITFKNQLNSLIGFFTTLILGILVCFAAYSKIGLIGLIYGVIAISLVLLSVIVVHIQYLNANYRVILKKIDENKFIYRKDDIEHVIDYENVLHIEKFISYNFRASRGLLPTDCYNYSKITLKDGVTLIITSLKIDDFLYFKDKTKEYKRFIAMII